MPIDLKRALLFTIKEAGNHALCRTAVQKLLYFEQELRIVDTEFKPYYYGPYSVEVAGSLQSLAGLDFIDENASCIKWNSNSQSPNWVRYGYSVTKDGEEVIGSLEAIESDAFKKISSLVKIVRSTAGLDQRILSCAAKIHFIVKRESRPMQRSEIVECAKGLGWNLTASEIDAAVVLLQELGLVEAATH